MTTNFCISCMFATDDSWGALRAMTTAPTMHRKQAILPIMLRRSLRKIAERIAVTTTVTAPRGVTRMASVKARAAKLHSSPKIMRVMPVHHQAFLR